MNPTDTRPAAEPRRIAYLMTHYPRVALTFVFDEIAGLEEDRSIRIFPIAINAADERDRDRPGFAAAMDRTLYVKALGKPAVLGAVARAFRASPTAFVGVLVLALRSAGTDLKRLVWRLFHAVEAFVIWDHCHRNDVRQLHAHFAQLPSTLAWLTTEFGNRAGDGHWTFSMTVHGPHELADEREAYFATKTAACSFVVGISDFTAAQIKRAIRPEDWPKVHVVRCGIDLDRFAYSPRAELGEPPTIAIVARLSPEKGHLVLIDAVDELRARGVAVRVDIVGDGAFRPAVEARVAELDLGDRISLLGELHTDQVAQRLRQVDLFCLPSFFEGIPTSIMEAMASGLPVVATSVGGIPELVVDHRTGLLVAPGRADLLADAIEEFVRAPELRAELRVAARTQVAALHDRTTTIKGLATLL